MPIETSDLLVPASTASKRWIDLLLLSGGVVLVLAGVAPLGVPLLLVGFLVPFLEWRTRRAAGIEHVLDLVPTELAEAHRSLVAAASRPGVVDADAVVAGADDLVLEVAAVLGGRPARRASQRRHVAVRQAVLESVTSDLAERHHAWRAAMEELDDIAPAEPQRSPSGASDGTGWLSTVLLVVLAPSFLVVDLVRGAVRLVRALVEGVALRLRTIADLVVAGGRAVVRAVAGAVRSWRRLTVAVREAARTARGRFVAARTLAVRRLLRRSRRWT